MPKPARKRFEVGTGPPSAGRADPLIVMMGASAGGLDSFKKFFGHMPADSGMAFILIPHLAPGHKSMMSELLSRQTRMPVREAIQGRRVRANHVYVIPPNRDLGLASGRIVLSHLPPSVTSHTALDYALTSLALDQKENAIGIILSGTGSHGTSGLREIRLAGGLTVAQDPATAEYSQMPRSVIAAGMTVDHVLAPEAMPKMLIDYASRLVRNHGRAVKAAGPPELNTLEAIGALLRARVTFDIRHYRKAMVMRRLRRRMALTHSDTLERYLEYLRREDGEITAFRNDLLIGSPRSFASPEHSMFWSRKCCHSSSSARLQINRCACGCRPARVAKRLTLWPCCSSSSSWRRTDSRVSRSSPRISTARP